MGRLDGDYRSNPARAHHPVQKHGADKQPVKQNGGINNAATLKASQKLYAQQQKERLERLYAAGAGSTLAIKDVGLLRATSQADKAYEAVYSQGLKSGKDWIEVSKNAELAYRGELQKAGFTASDVKGTSFAKALDLINSEAARDGNFKTLTSDAILSRMGDEPKYLVRIADKGYAASATSKIAGKKNVWFATAEEIAGAKKNVFEVMQRVGYTAKDIKDARDAIKSGTKSISDYYLVIAEADGTKDNGIPKWNRVVDEVRTMNAAGEADFQKFGDSKQFWQKVENLDFEKTVRRAKQKGLSVEDYAAKLPRSQRKVVLARQQIKKTFTATEMFTGKGSTRRADGQNGGMGVNERWAENFELHSQRRIAFTPLNNDAKSTKVDTVSEIRTISDNPLNLRGEMKIGGLAGGGISAATTLYQIFNQPGEVDYKSAARTLVSNTALGTTVGALSSGGERIVGRGVENLLERSAGAQRGIDRLFTNGTARNIAGRLAGNQTASITSQTFNSTVRTVAGRIGGAGVIGGVVNGAFSAYDQIGAYNRGEVTGSQAVGTVVGEASVGVGAGLAGAAAGAAIGSIIPGAGTLVGGVIGFGVGVAAGYLADKGLRGLGVNTMIAEGVTATIDAGAALVGEIHNAGTKAVNTISNAAESVSNTVSSAVSDVGNAVSGGLKSVFGW